MTIQALLDLVERWQEENDQAIHFGGGAPHSDALARVDLDALRTACQQHAEQLRTLRWNMAPMYEQGLLDAASFLAPSPASGGDK